MYNDVFILCQLVYVKNKNVIIHEMTSCFCMFFSIIYMMRKFHAARGLLFRMGTVPVTALRFIVSAVGGGEECAVCGRISLMIPVCSGCRMNRLSVAGILSVRRCAVCGKVLLSCDGMCMQCRTSRVLRHTSEVTPLFPYRLWNRELLFGWKIRGKRALSGFFAELMAEALRSRGDAWIVPVPPRPGKIRQRGWDQVEELARFLEFRYGFRVMRLLVRRSVSEQKKLDRKGRLSSMGNSYALASPRRFLSELGGNGGIVPERVCLIDDVCTTGATLESCAVLLRKAGIRRVDAMTLFCVD